MRSNTFLIDNSQPEFIFILGSSLLMEGVCGAGDQCRELECPHGPTQMDKMRGERGHS